MKIIHEEAGHRQIPPPESEADGTDAPASLAWLLCRAGSQLCALPASHLIETMRMLPMEQLAGAPHYVRGLCIIRGSPVPVIDIGALLFDHIDAPCERLVTVRTETRTIALATKAVLGLQMIGARALQELPPLLRDAATKSIAAVAMRDAELVFLLRALRLFPEELLAHIDLDGGLA